MKKAFPNFKFKMSFLVHISVWLIFLIIILIPIYTDIGKISNNFIAILISYILLFYVNYLYLVPKFLLKKRNLIYLLLVIVLIFIPTFFPVDSPIPPPGFDDNFIRPRPPRFPIISFIISIAFIVAGTSIRVYMEWNKNEIIKKEKDNQKSKTELHFLKHQLSPHFLFNSLNSIYSLSTKKSPDASEAIITLSELMRYMLYQTNTELVPLKDELDYIQNYLKLQRLRIANNENVTINIHGSIGNQKITPLLLISFIENAFKYGTDFKGNTEVKIGIVVHPDKLEFTCINIIGHRKESSENSGIGLVNTRERLKLLYPQKHILSVKEVENRFVVSLTLDLDP